MENHSSLQSSSWSLLEKIGFRFFFVYFTLFITFENNGAYPFFVYISRMWSNFLNNYIPWVGKHILGIPYDFKGGPNGSGDTTFDYVILFCILMLAIIVTVIWSFLDRKRKNYAKMYYWLTVALRFYVGLMLINYGLVKVIQVQFSSPGLYRLTQPYGESSPMGLAWTFLGFSKGYNLFMGIAEVAAVLLLFRRTLTLGLIITIMTTANVMAVNYFYDVPVKILSTHLVLICLFLIARDFKKLLTFFLLRVPVSLTDIYKPKLKRGLKMTFTILKVLVIAYALGYGLIETMRSKERYYGEGTKSPLQGLYEVREITLNGKTKTYDELTTKDWKYLAIERKGFAQVQLMSLKREWMTLKIDSTSTDKFTLTSRGVDERTYEFEYGEGDNSDFFLKGTVNSDTLFIKMKRYKDFKEKFLLTNRGFHWINEMPYNR
ncbi:hypothetical protein [Pseudotenacibaculum haliotis]|uniref:DoxX family protein n=1 Tax=Pseudotenacibaculum haliotis TaxID=1862138 RepID=A0ABW5LRW8_9FLAO